MMSSLSSFLYDNLISPISGPIESVYNTYNFLTKDLGIESEKLLNAATVPFLSSFGLNALGLYIKYFCTTNENAVRSAIMERSVSSSSYSELVQIVVLGAVIKSISGAANQYYQGYAAANISSIAIENYHPKYPDNQSIHHLNKLIDHSTHFVFDTVLSVYDFMMGAKALYSLGCGVATPAILLGTSIGVNWLVDNLIQENLHNSKDLYNDAREEVQDKINNHEIIDSSLIQKHETTYKNTDFWKAIQDNVQANIINYWHMPLKLLLCIHEGVTGSEGLSQMYDALDNLSSPFSHHLEHGDDVADDQVYLSTLKESLYGELELFATDIA